MRSPAVEQGRSPEQCKEKLYDFLEAEWYKKQDRKNLQTASSQKSSYAPLSRESRSSMQRIRVKKKSVERVQPEIKRTLIQEPIQEEEEEDPRVLELPIYNSKEFKVTLLQENDPEVVARFKDERDSEDTQKLLD